MLKNLIGLFIGLFIINSIVFLVSYFMQAEQGITAMFVACFGSFFSFIGSQFLPIPLLKRIFGLGLVIGFIGSFLTGLFHNNYVVAQYLNTFKSVPTFSVTQKPKIDISKVYYFKLSDYKILTDNKTKYTKRSRSDTQDYYIMPIVATNETTNDSIFWWVGFRYRESLGGETYKDYMNYALSKKALANIVLESYDSLNFAAAIQKATSQHDLKVSKSCIILEMTDMQMKEDLNKQQFHYTWLIINAIWLFAGIFVMIKLRVASVS
jgi:hypothetical protein